MSDGFVHLHVHSYYSLLKGTSSPENLARIAHSQGANALALTDLGVLHGVVPFVQSCSDLNIKPIVGCEFTIDGDQLVLIAETNAGYSNLCRLSTYASVNELPPNPDVLAQHHQGIIALFRSDSVSSLWMEDGERVRRSVDLYRDIFGKSHLFLALFEDGTDNHMKMNQTLIRSGMETDVGIVATNDVYYGDREESRISGMISAMKSGKAVSMNTDAHHRKSTYLKSPRDMARLFQDIPEALSNTIKIAERCHIDLQMKDVKIPIFDKSRTVSADEHLKQLVMRGAESRFGENISDAVVNRINHELNVISNMGFSDYFLIVSDIISFANNHRIPVGPGRGSSASSMVAYTLGITQIDPLKYGLFFERFLNPERKTMPDIDIDLCQHRRGEVINYVRERYGNDRLAHICTFGTLTARAAVREVGRLLEIPDDAIDDIATLIPSGQGITIEEAIQAEPRLKQMFESSRPCQQLEFYSRRVQGLPRHLSTHAAGIVITPCEISEHIPLCKSPDGTVVTQFVGDDLETLGFLKIDLLGLRTLTAIDRTVQSVFEQTNVTIAPGSLPLNDAKVFKMLSNGHSEAVFQLETPMFQRLLHQMKPENFNDIVALLALGRPGPMARVDEFLRMRHGRKTVENVHPILRAILTETFGFMLYQEQVMFVASEIGGFTPGEADLLRRAMTSKDDRLMEQERTRFVRGATDRGIDKGDADEIFSEMRKFAAYGFPKSHSVAYASLTYLTSYLKAHFPAHYMAAQMNTTIDAPGRISKYVTECKRLGIHVRGPDVNVSHVLFSVDRDSIVFGLAAVHYVGDRLATAIVRHREDGPYVSVQDFVRRQRTRSPLKEATLSLIKIGAFDSLYNKREDAFDHFNNMHFGMGGYIDDPGQTALFSGDRGIAGEGIDGEDRLRPYRAFFSHFKIPDFSPRRSRAQESHASYTICGIVRKVHSGDGDHGLRSFILKDIDDNEVIISLPADGDGRFGPISTGSIVAVKGRMRPFENGTTLVADVVKMPTALPLVIRVQDMTAFENYVKKIKQSPGNRPVVLKLKGTAVSVELALSIDHWVDEERLSYSL